jgi:hypothetical protein
MPFKPRKTGNPFGITHPCAVVTFGETVSGGAIITCMDDSLVPLKPFISSFKVEFVKAIAEDLVGESKYDVPLVDGKYDFLQGSKTKTHEVVTELRTVATGEYIGKVTAVWVLEQDESKKSK